MQRATNLAAAPTRPRLGSGRTRAITMGGTAPRVATLVVRTPHEPGIVSALQKTLASRGVTVLDSAHFSDDATETYFQRVRIDVSTLPDRAKLEGSLAELATRSSLSWRLSYDDSKPRIAIFVSKEEHCLYDLLLRHRAGELRCEIAMVISNHDDACGVAAHFGIPFHHLPVTKETRSHQEELACGLMDAARIELVVLARYMQILSPAFVARYPGRIINVHHSFLPAFVGASPYRQAHDKGVKMVGATSHYVTADLDQGPIIEQAVARVNHRDAVGDLTRKGRDLEKQVLAAAVRWHLEDRVMVTGGKTIVFE